MGWIKKTFKLSMLGTDDASRPPPPLEGLLIYLSHFGHTKSVTLLTNPYEHHILKDRIIKLQHFKNMDRKNWV